MSLQKTAEKLKRAKELKDEGNSFFKAENPSQAFRHYYEAYLHINGLDSAPDERATLPEPMKEDLRQTISVILSNIAAVHAKYQNWPKVIDNCTKAIARNPVNAKAFFRRGQAFFAQGSMASARSDFEGVLNITPNDPETQRELNKVKGLEKQQEVKQKREFAGMFDRTKEEKRVKTSST